MKSGEFGIQKNASGEYDQVALDGDIWRDNHAGFQALINLGTKNGCIFKHAWTGVSPYSKRNKKWLQAKATPAGCRRNLMIPETCNTFSRCQKQIKELKKMGYLVHVVG